MRNLKRALSLLLSSTMVLGMLVMGSSAKTFTDAEDISNAEAVTIVDGLDVMNGYPDGSFKPEGIVTRAEMAVVISKMLYGPEFNPANFEGAGTFTDTPDWAEGYINLCASLDIIAGRGNGIFDPNATVTTSEAAAMFLRTLGYLQTSEEFGTDWQLAVTSKATNLGLYGDLKLSINEGLSRENVAEMAFNTLFAQRVAYDDYRGLYVKANDRNVVVTNGTDDENNTLAQNTFGLYAVEGVVTANSATTKSMVEDDNTPALTNVVFEDAVDLDRDGHATHTDYDFEYETGLDLIGHKVNVYYTIEKNAPVVYAMVDEATQVKTLIGAYGDDEALNTAAKAEGFKRGTASNAEYYYNYVDQDKLVKEVSAPTFSVNDGQATILISNSGDMSVDVVILLDQYLDKVKDIDTTSEAYTFETNYVFYEGEFAVTGEDISKDDYVIVTPIDNNKDGVADFHNMYVANVFQAEITKITRKTATNVLITADGTDYSNSDVNANQALLAGVTAALNVTKLEKTGIILDENGLMVGTTQEVEKSYPYAYVAQWGAKHDGKKLTDPLTLAAEIYFADGTSEVHFVKASNISAINTAITAPSGYASLNTEDYTTLYSVSIDSDGYATINRIAGTNYGAGTNEAGTATTNQVTKITNGLSYVGTRSGKNILANNDTVFFYVNGTYGTDLTVEVITGIKNAVNVNSASNIEAAYITNATSYYTLDTALIEGVPTNTLNAYYYDGKYTVTYNDTDKYVVTYQVWKDGEATTLVYTGYESEAKAIAAADTVSRGYVVDGSNKPAATIDGSTIFVDPETIVNVSYNPYVENIFTASTTTGVIAEKAQIVDLTGNNINSLAALTTAVKNIIAFGGSKYQSINVAYSYNNDSKVIDTLYVTDVVKTNDPAVDGSQIFAANPVYKGGAGGSNFVFNITARSSNIASTPVNVSWTIYHKDAVNGDAPVASNTTTVTTGAVDVAVGVDTGVAVPAGGNYFVRVTINGVTHDTNVYYVA